MEVTDPDAGPKKLIEQSYQTSEQFGLAGWTTDQAGLFQAVPYPRHGLECLGHSQRQPHE